MHHRGWSAYSLCSRASRLLLFIFNFAEFHTLLLHVHMSWSYDCCLCCNAGFRYNKLAELRDNKVQIAKGDSIDCLSEDMVCNSYSCNCKFYAIWMLPLLIVYFIWLSEMIFVAVDRVTYIYGLPETCSWDFKCNFDLCPAKESWGIIFWLMI